MPTALLPGIGASMRSERAARAIARSSARPSMRLTLMSGAGWTSYWVTTGPALRPTILAGMPKLASLRTMISSTWAWAAASPPAWIGIATSSSRVVGGRTYSIRSRVGRRVAGIGDVVRVAGSDSGSATATRGGRSGSTTGGPGRGERGGRRDRARDGDRDGVAGRFVVLAPDAGLAGGRPGRRRPFPWAAPGPCVRPFVVVVAGGAAGFGSGAAGSRLTGFGRGRTEPLGQYRGDRARSAVRRRRLKPSTSRR